MKHVKVVCHFIRDMVTRKELHAQFICSDIPTKPLMPACFLYYRSKLNMSSFPTLLLLVGVY